MRGSGSLLDGEGRGDTTVSADDVFVWKQGRSEVSLVREGAMWQVVYTSAGRLLGPRQVIHQMSHKEAKQAAWDVMARVIRACRDEDEGLKAGRSAAQWMRSHPLSQRAADA